MSLWFHGTKDMYSACLHNLKTLLRSMVPKTPNTELWSVVNSTKGTSSVSACRNKSPVFTAASKPLRNSTTVGPGADFLKGVRPDSLVVQMFPIYYCSNKEGLLELVCADCLDEETLWSCRCWPSYNVARNTSGETSRLSMSFVRSVGFMKSSAGAAGAVPWLARYRTVRRKSQRPSWGLASSRSWSRVVTRPGSRQ